MLISAVTVNTSPPTKPQKLNKLQEKKQSLLFKTHLHNAKFTEVRWNVTRYALLRHLMGSM